MTDEFLYREATLADVPQMAQVRSRDWESEEFWQKRIPLYLTGQSHPQMALAGRIAFVCVDGDCVAGFIAGHLTRRHECDGELQWISIRPQYRRRQVASSLLRLLAQWFRGQSVARVCVNVEPENVKARAFYAAHGAIDLKPHWMVWEDMRKVLAAPNLATKNLTVENSDSANSNS
jgi:ribosomal protein S18 acetylase RimI-like enzyme